MALRVVDLEQIAPNDWRLRGTVDVYLSMVERTNTEGFPVIRWDVRADIKGPAIPFTTMRVALSHAFAMACGRAVDVAKELARRR